MKRMANLARYVALCKTLRAVVFFHPARPFEEGVIEWLARRHRRKDLGIPSPLYSISPRFQREPFVELTFPDRGIRDFFRQFCRDIPSFFVEGVVLASCYASPLVVVGSGLDEIIERVAVVKVRTKEGFGEEEFGRLLRVAGHSMVDLIEAGSEALGVVSKFVAGKAATEDLEGLLYRREQRALNDLERRFSRLKDDPQGELRLCYLDPVRMAVPLLLSADKEELSRMSLSPLIGLGMGIVCALLLKSPPKGG
ncbi:MAG TPA: hypothetical protein EYP65_06695 [Armatimonadetes bacterium]|nr:hypothetical protein [Armatimonadota bacterium]